MFTVTAYDLQSAIEAFQSSAVRCRLNTGRYEMNYFVWGTGIPVVFVHGMADSARAFLMVMHRLIPSFTCISYELPNGKTDGSNLNRYGLPDYTSDLITLLDHLGIDQAAVVGSSFGSLIAIDALHSNPKRFTHGVLQNGFAYRPLTRWHRKMALVLRFFPGWVADWPFIYKRIMTRIEQSTFSNIEPEVADFFMRQSGNTPFRAVALRALTIDRTNLLPLLPYIRIPILLLSGDKDKLVPATIHDKLAQTLPNVTLTTFNKCAHYPQYTCPSRMAESIEQFITHLMLNVMKP